MHEIGEGIGFVGDDQMHVVAHQTPSDDPHVEGTPIRVEIREKRATIGIVLENNLTARSFQDHVIET